MFPLEITINIPKWAFGKNIYLFAGAELLGELEYNYQKIKKDNGSILRKKQYFPLKMKPIDGRCNGCGDCCGSTGLKKDFLFKIANKILEHDFENTKGCALLDPTLGCIMEGKIPFGCVKSNCEGWSENCTEKLIPVNNDAIILEVI